MSGILFSKGRDFGLGLRLSSARLVLFASSIASQGMVLATRSVATRLALGASNARLVFAHV